MLKNNQYSEYLKYLFMIRDGKTISDDISFKDIIDILVKENVKDLNELLIKDIKNR